MERPSKLENVNASTSATARSDSSSTLSEVNARGVAPARRYNSDGPPGGVNA